jgi:hypothetical protein
VAGKPSLYAPLTAEQVDTVSAFLTAGISHVRKKTQKTPQAELDLARARQKEVDL